MIRRRFDRSSMLYRLGISRRAARPASQPRTQSTRPRYPRVCVGVASLRLRRRMPRATRAFEARLKPPPAQRQLFAWAASRAAAVVSADAQRTPSTKTGP